MNKRRLYYEKPAYKKAIAEDVKREVLKELNLGNFQPPALVETIKKEVLLELTNHPYPQSEKLSKQNGALIDAIKNEILMGIEFEFPSHLGSSDRRNYPNQMMIETVKNEVIAEIEREREKQKENCDQLGRKNKQEQYKPDPMLVEAVKRKVLAEIQLLESR